MSKKVNPMTICLLSKKKTKKSIIYYVFSTEPVSNIILNIYIIYSSSLLEIHRTVDSGYPRQMVSS